MGRGDIEGEGGVFPISRQFITAADHTAQRHSVPELDIAVCRSSYGMHTLSQDEYEYVFSIMYESGYTYGTGPTKIFSF